MKKKIANIIKLIIALGLGLLIVWLSLKNLSPTERHNIINSFKIADYSWVIFSIFIGVLSHLTRAARWKILLKPMGYTPSLYNSFLAVMVGYFANLGIPRSGELARCTILRKEEGIPVNKSFGTVIVERAIDMVFFFILFFITLAVEIQRIDAYVQETIYPKVGEKFAFLSMDHVVSKFLLIAVLVLIPVLFLTRKRLMKVKIIQKTIDFIKGIWEGLKSISKIEKPWLFVYYSIQIWIFYYLMVYLTLFALPATSGLGPMAGMSILVLGSIGIMVTPGGIGLYPLIVSQTLFLYEITDTSLGLAMGWITWSAQTIMIIALGGISLILVSLKPNKL